MHCTMDECENDCGRKRYHYTVKILPTEIISSVTQVPYHSNIVWHVPNNHLSPLTESNNPQIIVFDCVRKQSNTN